MTAPWNTGWTVHLYDQYGEECVGYDPQPLDGFIKDVWVEGSVVHLTTHLMRFFFVGPLGGHRRVVGCDIKNGHRGMGLGATLLENPVWPTIYGDMLNLSLTAEIPTHHWSARTLREPRLAA